jgi:desampylase
MEIMISRAHREEMLAAAAAAPDREVCGLLFGEGGRIEAVQPCANVSAQPEDSFEIDPAALIAAHKAEREGGRKLIGCYHSHPNGWPEPSARDADAAQRDMPLWLIIAGGALTAWRWDGTVFTAL